MLTELRIQNFAIIDRLDLSFGRGLNVITGETGAGKSILIDAVELLLGGKADPAFIRAGMDKAVIEGTFALASRAQAVIGPVLQREDLLDADHGGGAEITISREVKQSGRSTARVNGVSVNLDVLSEIGGLLVDVHGQSAHLSLLKPTAHLDLLDRYAEVMDVRSGLASVVNRLATVRAEIDRLLQDEAARQRRADRLRHEIDEIDTAELRPGEDEELRAERNRLANSEQLAKLSAEAVTLLYGSDRDDGLPALDAVLQASALIGRLAAIDPDLKDEHSTAIETGDLLDELAASLRRYAEAVEYNPQRLDEVEERLELINTLKRRYGSSIAVILDHANAARAELDGIANSAERIAELREQETVLLRHIGELAERISRARKAAAARLAEGIVHELADLRMAKARFEVRIDQRPDPAGCIVGQQRLAFDVTGIDSVEFMLSANPGEPLRPLAKVASGGEAARIMLALKRVLTLADHTPTLIFDEIDSGVGGTVADSVGALMKQLGRSTQVLAVTHLAQVAACADAHLVVAKSLKGRATVSEVHPVQGESRVAEVARMLGGEKLSGTAHAQAMIDRARQPGAGAPSTPVAWKTWSAISVGVPSSARSP